MRARPELEGQELDGLLLGRYSGSRSVVPCVFTDLEFQALSKMEALAAALMSGALLWLLVGTWVEVGPPPIPLIPLVLCFACGIGWLFLESVRELYRRARRRR